MHRLRDSMWSYSLCQQEYRGIYAAARPVEASRVAPARAAPPGPGVTKAQLSELTRLSALQAPGPIDFHVLPSQWMSVYRISAYLGLYTYILLTSASGGP